jgi:ATP synthase protein I
MHQQMPRPLRATAWRDHGTAEDEHDDEPIRPLTRDEAQRLRAGQPPLSLWRLVAAQAAVGAVVAAVAWGWSGRGSVAASALYGAFAVVAPTALMVLGLSGKSPVPNAGAMALRFLAWEFVKLGASVGLLLLAPKLVVPLSWPALLAALVLCMKVNWLALLWRGRVKSNA